MCLLVGHHLQKKLVNNGSILIHIHNLLDLGRDGICDDFAGDKKNCHFLSALKDKKNFPIFVTHCNLAPGDSPVLVRRSQLEGRRCYKYKTQ